jgi:putative peptidoglycan lipid II flippase
MKSNGLYTWISQDVRGLHSAALSLGVFALLSQLLALFRDRLLAFLFGASTSLDIYYSAFRIPDLLFIVIGAIVSASVAVPLLTEARIISEEQMKKLINSLFSFYLLIILVLSAGAYFFMPQLASLFFPGLDSVTREGVIELSRVMLLSPFLLGISSLFASIVQVKRRFVIYSLSPVLYNIGIIFGILALYPVYGLPGLAWGVVVGAFFHMVIQVPYIISSGYFPFLTGFSFRDMWMRVVEPSIPRTLSLSMVQILFILLVAAATRLQEGSIGILSLAYNLQSVPVSLIGVSYSLSAFSLLTAAHAEGNIHKFREAFDRSVSWIFFLAIPLSVFSILYSGEIISVVLGTGAFDDVAQARAAKTFAYFAVSVVFQSLALLFTRALYAMGKTWEAFLPNFIGFLVSSILVVRWMFSPTLLQEEYSLALAFSLGSIITTALLILQFSRAYAIELRSTLSKFISLVAVWFIAGTVSFVFFSMIHSYLIPFATAGIVVGTLIGVLAGLITGYYLLILFDVAEVIELRNLVRSRLPQSWRRE